jgi:hypothetical protein
MSRRPPSQEESAEHQRVGVQDLRKVLLREPDVDLIVGRGNVADRRIQNEHSSRVQDRLDELLLNFKSERPPEGPLAP